MAARGSTDMWSEEFTVADVERVRGTAVRVAFQQVGTLLLSSELLEGCVRTCTSLDHGGGDRARTAAARKLCEGVLCQLSGTWLSAANGTSQDGRHDQPKPDLRRLPDPPPPPPAPKTNTRGTRGTPTVGRKAMRCRHRIALRKRKAAAKIVASAATSVIPSESTKKKLEKIQERTRAFLDKEIQERKGPLEKGGGRRDGLHLTEQDTQPRCAIKRVEQNIYINPSGAGIVDRGKPPNRRPTSAATAMGDGPWPKARSIISRTP